MRQMLRKGVPFCLFLLCAVLGQAVRASAAPCNFSIVQNPQFSSSLSPWQNPSGNWFWFNGASQGEARDESYTANKDALSQMIYGVVPGSVLIVQPRWAYEDDSNPGASNAARIDVSYAGVVYASFTTAHYGDSSGVGTFSVSNGATISPATDPNIIKSTVYSITLPAGVPEQGVFSIAMTTIEKKAPDGTGSEWFLLDLDSQPASICLQDVTQGGTQPYTFTTTNLDDNTATTAVDSSASITTGTPGTAATYDANAIVPLNQAVLDLTLGSAATITQTAQPNWVLSSVACTDQNNNAVSGYSLSGNQLTVPGSLTGTSSLLICTFTNTPNVAVTKAFSPTTILSPAASALTISIANTTSGAAAMSGMGLTDSLPSGVTVAPVPAASTTCGGGTVSAAAGATQVKLSNGSVAAGATCTVSVNVTSSVAGTYTNTIPVGALTTSAGATNSALASATLTVTVPSPTVAATKTDNGPWTIGQAGAQYTITPKNTGTAATSGTITVTDTLPAALTTSATPTGTGWSCSVTGGNAITCTSTSVIAAGANGTPITIPVNVGNGTPTGTNAISNTAKIFGGGDSVHNGAGTAAQTPADQTTIFGTPTLTNAPTNGNVAASSTATDTFTLTNTAGQNGKFNVPSVPTITGPGGAIAPSGYIINGAGPVYASLAALQTALAALPASANGASITVGVEYAVPANVLPTQTITDKLPATLTAAGVTSSTVSATVTDTVLGPTLAVAKADNGPWTIGQVGAQYTITPKNTGNVATSGTITVTDTVPGNLTLNGTPTGTGWACSVTGGTALTCTSSTAIGSGQNGNAIAVPVLIGAGTATGTKAISNVADAFGGSDAAHPNAGSPAASPPDQTTVNGPAGLTNTTSDSNIAPGAAVTDTFSLTNTSGQSGNFSLPSLPQIAGPGGAIAMSGAVINGGGTVYTTLASLNAALAALPASANNASITVGVRYTAPASSVARQTITDQVFATITAGGATSSPASAVATDTIVAPTLGLSKTDNGPWTIGQAGALYTIVPSNSGNGATSGTITLTDSLPSALTASGTPSGAGWACSVTGGTAVSCTSTTAIAAGANGASISVPVTIGAGTPTGANAISNVADAFGGGDPVHTNAGTAVASTPDQTTINAAPSLTIAPTDGTVTAGSTASDIFTLTNTSGQAGKFTVPAAPTITGPSGAIAPSGYVVNGGATVYPTLAALQAALAALPATANAAAITIGVQYAVPANSLPAQTFTDQLTATVSAGGATSGAASATVSDSVLGSSLALTKTDNGPWTIGQVGAQYTITPRNAGNAATAGTITITDTVPANLTLNGTPVGTGWACSVTGTTALTCTSTTAIAAGASGAPIAIPVNVGAGTALGSNAISNTAKAFGGGDAVHTSPATAVSSPADQTSINGPAQLSNTTNNSNVVPATTVTDTFTLTNLSGQAGTFNVPSSPAISGSGGSVAPSGYIINGGATVYPTLAALQAALASLSTPNGANVKVGVQYAVPAGSSPAQTFVDQLFATVTAGGATSVPVAATATDTVRGVTLFIVKTDNGPWTIGQAGAQYTITVTNNGNAPTTGTITVTDTLPAGLTTSSVPAGNGWSCSVNGGAALTCTSTVVIAAGANGAPIKVAVTIGPSTPVGTNAITNVASAFGGGDLMHATAGTAVASDFDLTTINGSAALTNAAVSSNVAPGTTATDTFTITNTSPQAGKFNAPTVPTIAGPAGGIAASGYVVNGGATVYPTLAALQTALAALAPTASGGSITIGVQYPVPKNFPGQSILDTFAPTLTSAGVTSAPAPSTATDTIDQVPALTVTANTPAGQAIVAGASTTDTFTLTNTGSTTGTFTVTPKLVTSGGQIVPATYTLTVAGVTTSYPSVAGLNAALAGTPIASGGTVVIGVVYSAPANSAGATVTTTVSSTISSPSSSGPPAISAPSSASETDRLPGELSISKSANTTSAQPGDTVTYAIDVTNQSVYPASNTTISDVLPDGMTWVPNSLVASINNQAVAVIEKQFGNTVLITLPAPIAAGATVHVVYALTIGPAAVIGQAKAHLLAKGHLLSKGHLLAVSTNIATVVAQVNGAQFIGGPATATIFLQPGLLDSCGTILGRVFVDATGNGRQEPGEKGLARAVIVLDDGTRIQTDDQGLFHVECTNSGWRTGTLDLTSVPGYGVAGNATRLDRRSATISVHLEPGGLVRMNFTLAPAGSAGTGKQQ